MRTAAAWLVGLAAAGGGVLAAHAAAYALTEPPAHRAAHGYLPLAEALVCAALALGVALAVRVARCGPLARPRPALYAVAPPLAFALQETAERGFAPPLEPVVLLGLALQLPFALAAYAAARLLLRAAEALAAPAAPARTPLRGSLATPTPHAPPRAESRRTRAPRAPPVPA